ncbi:MAG: alkaline phosphatase family protein [Clostridia bacterium]
MIERNFENSLLNLSATLANFVGVETGITMLKSLENKLNENTKNVVFIIFDGLGLYNVNELTENNDTFYKNHIIDTIKSTIPATTTNATTSLLSTKYPDEHLWLSWSLFLKEQNKVSEIFLSRDYYTHLPTEKYIGGDITAFVDKSKTDRKISVIAPSYVKNFEKVEKLNANSIQELFEKLDFVVNNNDNNKFVYCYCDEPDHTMHEFGIKSKETKEKFKEIQTRLEDFLKQNSDILIITTADHGHIDISEYIEIYKDEEIMDLIERPLSMENRFTSIKVKKGKDSFFKKLFIEKYGNDFDLYESDYLINLGIFGNGENKEKIKEFLGDFVVIGNNTFKALAFCDDLNRLKGNHSGYTKEEMEVPICIFPNN